MSSVLETQVAAIATHAEGITTANGYAFDVGTVLRPSRLASGFEYLHRNVVVQCGARMATEEQSAGKSTYTLPVYIRMLLLDPDDGTFDTLVNEFSAAVEKRFCGTESWMQTGTINYTLSGPDEIPDGAPASGAQMTLTIVYRHVYGDPFTA